MQDEQNSENVKFQHVTLMKCSLVEFNKKIYGAFFCDYRVWHGCECQEVKDSVVVFE